MTQASLGLVLTAIVAGVSWLAGGATPALGSGSAGLLATGIEVLAVRLLEPALESPYERLVRRWAYGLGLRAVGVGLVAAVVVLRWPRPFPPLATALGFVAVLIPLLFREMRMVLMRLRTGR